MRSKISLIVAAMLLACAVSACGTVKETQPETESAKATETAAAETEAAEAETQVIELGTSGLSITVPASYASGEITSEDTDENQVAYYTSEDSLVDFDIYQWAKAEGETLKSAAEQEAAEYEATASEVTFNDVTGMYYEAVEESEGTEYTTGTYIFENGDFFAEIVFWLDGETASEEVNAMISTIVISGSAEITKEGTEILLGTSSLKLTTPVVYTAGELTAEDTDENQVAYYASEDTKVDFDVYQWTKAEGETLEGIAADEAAEYEAEIEMLTIGELTVAKYSAVEESDGQEYPTATYIVEDGSDFVEVVFWLDGDDAEETVDSIINTLTR